MAKLGRNQTSELLDDESRKGLTRYLEGPIRAQLLAELGRVPEDVTFVYGHTHKPFARVMSFAGYPSWVKVYNLGAWVVDTEETPPVAGGAVVLVDEALDVVSLRMYNEADDVSQYAVKLETLDETTAFYHQLRNAVDPHSGPWQKFSRVVSRTLDERGEAL